MENHTVSKAKDILSSQADRFLMRTMADFVKDYLSQYCDEHQEFAEKVSAPGKNFAGCIKKIHKEALKWLQDQPNTDMEGQAGVCGDVPNELCYGWAVDYYNSEPELKPTVTTNVGSKKSSVVARKPGQPTPSVPKNGEFIDDGIDRAATPGGKKTATEQMSLLGI